MNVPREPKLIKIPPESELAKALDEAERDGGSVLLEKDGVTYRVIAEGKKKRTSEDLFRDFDSEKAREALREAAGSWADVDADKLIADIYRWRQEGSRPIDEA